MRYRFGSFELDTDEFELKRGGHVVPTQRKVFDLIAYLVERSERFASKEDLLDELWPDEHVSESALPWCVSQARKALGQKRSEKSPIETVHGRGYRFHGDVERIEGSSPTEPTVARDMAQHRTPPEPPFVGRNDVLRVFRETIQAAEGGRGGLVILSGDAGIGKTRCAEEAAKWAAGRGVSVWRGRGVEGETPPAFWPWVQVLRDLVADAQVDEAVRTEAKDVLDRVEPQATLRDDFDASEVAGEFWSLDRLLRVLRASAKSSARLVILDDVQWVDLASVRALGLLAADVAHSHLVIVATLRNSDLDPDGPLTKRFRRVSRHARRIALEALELGDVATYAEEIVGRTLPETLSRAIYDVTGGNPLFVEETVRLVIERFGEEGASAALPTDIELPEAARDLIRSRLDGYPGPAREVLNAASVIGEAFDLFLLETVTSIGGEELTAILDRAVEERLIRELPGVGRYEFHHAVIRQTLYSDLPPADRRSLHRTVGESLERHLTGEQGIHQVARHLYLGLPLGDAARVVQHAYRAGRASQRVYAHEDAVTQYNWALEALHVARDDPRMRCRVLLGLASAHRGMGSEVRGRDYAEQAIDLARANRFADLMVVAARCLRPTYAWRRAPDEVARRALEDALDWLPREDARNRAAALGRLAGVPPYSRDAAESRRLSERAVEIARTIGGRALVDALHSGIASRTGPDDIDGLVRLTDEILALDERLGPSWAAAESRYARSQALIYAGDLDGASRELEEYGDLARRFRMGEALWNYDRNRAQMHFIRGEFAAAEQLWTDLSERSQKVGIWYGMMLLPTHRALLRYETHRTSPLSEGDGIWEQVRTLLTKGMVGERAQFALFSLDAGDREAARSALHRIVGAGIDSLPRGLDFLSTLSVLGELAARLDERGHAKAVYDALAPYPNHTTPDAFGFNRGCVSLGLGELADLLGDTDDARHRFENAVRRNDEMGLRPAAARSRYRLADLAARQGASRDAASIATAALSAARQLGLVALARDIEALGKRFS